MNRVGWVLQVAAAGMFVLAGAPKIIGNAQSAQMFESIGAPWWFVYMTGAIEVVSAIGLLIPATARFAALALAATMIGATYTHVALLHNSPAIPLVLLVVLSAIIWIRRNG
ncbi:MAG: DoxX family protein [Vicinamibacterales bacterium]